MLKKVLILLALSIPTAKAELCEKAQKIVAQIEDQPIRFKSAYYTNLDKYLRSKPQFKNGSILVRAYHHPGKPLNLEETLVPDQVWCKLKSAYAIKGSDTGGSCAEVNRNTIDKVILDSGLDEALTARINTQEDRITWTGSEWSKSFVDAEYNSNDHTITVQSTALKTPIWIPSVGGMHYCKLLTYTGARQLLEIVAD